MSNLTDEPGKVTRITPPSLATASEFRNPLIPEAWIVTFGLDHPLARRYIRVEGGEESVRKLMTRIFGPGNWGGIYREDMASRVIDSGRLTLLDLGLNR